MFNAISLVHISIWCYARLLYFGLWLPWITFSASLMSQVVDTPYLVNPEWKNFIPGYLYNDSELELTAESFYRQSKLILYVFRVTVFCENTFETRRSGGWLISSHPPAAAWLSDLHFVFASGYRTAATSLQQKRIAVHSLTSILYLILLRIAASVTQHHAVPFRRCKGCKWEKGRAQLLTLSS